MSTEKDNLPQAEGEENNKTTITPENEVDTTAETPQEPQADDVSNDDDKAISEIDESNAKDAEDEQSNDSIEMKAYEKMSLEELVDELEKLVKNEKIQAIKQHVYEIRKEFKSHFNTLVEEKKEEFLENGGNEIDFDYSNPLQKRFNEAYNHYKEKRNSHYNNLQKNLKENLAERQEIIEEIKGLLNVEENINTTYKHFKDLQDRWRNAGPIPRDKYNNTWNTYHHHVENFYDFLHLNRDLRDLDFKHNLEKKIKIIEHAEALAQEEDVNHAFRELQVLHKMWKEELGPVAKEYREDIWQRFKNATKAIHDKRQVYFNELDKIYEKNLEKKQEIIDNIKAISDTGATSHNGWQKSIKEVEALREAFFNAGKVPIKVNEATWAKFKDVVRTFNRKKNAFYKNLKKEQYKNLEKKRELVKIAEDNKDSEDFETTTPLMKKIQSDWKKIGHVPRKDSDKIWKQFKAACNHYFDKFHASRNKASEEELDNFNKKSELLQEIKGLKVADKETDLPVIKDYVEKWKALGNVPRNKRNIEKELNKTLDGFFKTLGLNPSEAELIKFDKKLEVLNNHQDSRHLDNERVFISKKIKEIKGEITQLENNLQFFTNVDDDNPLVKDVHKNIQKHKDELSLWKTKLQKIKKLY
ncbi:DUF349 domain-containing protein [Mangrovimonas spongiae]|uniref:DUF349 domain-containing protein n=1 Tax=Mangrovimonas spongiae TaxID=2494697 RepID=A0A428K2P1_9FLAO|nr:DUF349 domain-containing protein [Mangrovimonas spongiae]RSK40688.1 DUF349 domain-containing protein [Mangrovimonas spongiae]